MGATLAEPIEQYLAGVRIVRVVWLAHYAEFRITMQETNDVLCWRVKVHADEGSYHALSCTTSC
jgi:hypothetical protein